MPRFVALLRGVSPMNAKMPELKRCFEQAGFTNVRTVLSSGNVVFDAPESSEADLERRAELAMEQALDRGFYTIVRSSLALQELLASDPFAKHGVPQGAKRVVSFLRDARKPRVALPLELDGACILRQSGREIMTFYVPNEKGPVFMRLIEKAFGTDITTRTWETVGKCAAA